MTQPTNWTGAPEQWDQVQGVFADFANGQTRLEDMRRQWFVAMPERFRVTIRREGAEFVARDAQGQKHDLADIGLITPDMTPTQVAATLFWHSLKGANP